MHERTVVVGSEALGNRVEQFHHGKGPAAGGRLHGEGTMRLGTKGELQVLKVRGKGLVKDVERKAHGSDTISGLYFEGERTLTTTEFPGANMYVDQIEAFNRAVEEDTAPPVSGVDGLRVRELMTAILQSSREKRVIDLAATRYPDPARRVSRSPERSQL